MLPKPISHQNHHQQYRQPYSIFSFMLTNHRLSKHQPNQTQHNNTQIETPKISTNHHKKKDIKQKNRLNNHRQSCKRDENDSNQQNRSSCESQQLFLPKFSSFYQTKPEEIKLVELTNTIQSPSENKQKCEQDLKIYVDMKKKIKKMYKPHKNILSITQNVSHQYFLNQIYNDADILPQCQIFRNKSISQRIDNDVDTDDEQIASGMKKLERSLRESLAQIQFYTRSSDQIDIQQKLD